ncbi:MAG: TolC family protein [Myxococcales bacterium]|nr:TolC family protein [Myxococcales bacterium]
MFARLLRFSPFRTGPLAPLLLALLVLAPPGLTPASRGPVWAAPVAPAPSVRTVPVSVRMVLDEAVKGNLDLRREGISLRSARAQVVGALGQFDVLLDSNLTYAETITPSLNVSDLSGGVSDSVSMDIGVSRLLESGGSVRLALNGNVTDSTSQFLCGVGNFECRVYGTRLGLTLSHPILRGYGSQIAQATIERRKIQVNLALLNRQARAALVTRDVLTGYWELSFASRELEIRQSAVELARQQLEATRAQIAVGRLAPIDAAAVERAIADRTREVVGAEQAVLFRSLDLTRLLGRAAEPTFDHLVAADAPDITPHPVDVPDELARALANNPQLQSLRKGVALTELDIKVAQNTLRPQLDVVGQLGSTGRRAGFFDDALSQTLNFENVVWSVGLNFQLPVQNRAAKGQGALARLGNERAWLDAEALEVDLRDSVVRLSSNVEVAARRIQLGEQVVAFAKQNLEAELARFSVGRATNNDVLLRQQELKVAESQLLRSRVDLLLFEIALETVTGDVLERYGLVLRN